MSHLVGVDEILDLIAEVKEIDHIDAQPPQEGLVPMALYCEDQVYSEVFVTKKDFLELKEILKHTITFRLV